MGLVSTIVQVISSILLLLLIAFLSRTFYNIYLHPLSSFPGPKFYAASRLPLIRGGIKGHNVWVISQLHAKYGPVVRIAPNELSYTTATAWRTIYGHRGSAEEMAKDLDGAGLTRPPNGQHGILTADRENHARMRRLISHAFSEKALREQEGFLQQYVDLLIKGLKEHVNEPQNMLSWYNWTTFDGKLSVIGDLAFGSSFSCLDSQTPDPWITGLFTAIKIVPYIQALMYYRLLFILKYIVPASMLKARAATQARQHAKLDARLALGTDENRKDFLSYILRYNEDVAKEEGRGKALTEGEIFTNASLLIIAGSETTATLLCGVTYHLCRNRRVYRKLCAEIRGAFKDEKDITLQSCQELKYMLAVLDEAMRLYPPAPAALPRVVPKGGEVIDGQFVAGGTTVGVHQTSTYHSPTNFHNPLSFHPERWLPCDATSPFYNDNRAAFNPFSTGPRNCIGRNLAYAEMRLILARVLWNFDVELDGNTHEVDLEKEDELEDAMGGGVQGLGAWQEKQRVFLIWEKRDLMVKLTLRA